MILPTSHASVASRAEGQQPASILTWLFLCIRGRCCGCPRNKNPTILGVFMRAPDS